MNGVIIIDKPAGKTSHDVVQDVKKILGAKKVGHTGTLDPLATGVLPVCINEGTKLAQFFTQDRKEYLVTMLLGVTTDTYDVEGEVIAKTEPQVTREEIETALASLVGGREQIPPPYSAVKHKGKALYKWARQGVTITSPPRRIEIYRVSLQSVTLPTVTFTVACSKGTYIRTLCLELGNMLGCGACMAGLRRTISGSYSEQEAVRLATGENAERKEALTINLIPLGEVLPDLLAIEVEDWLEDKIRQGYQPVASDFLPHHIPFLAAGDMIRFKRNGHLIAIARMLSGLSDIPLAGKEERVVEILRVFNDE